MAKGVALQCLEGSQTYFAYHCAVQDGDQNLIVLLEESRGLTYTALRPNMVI